MICLITYISIMLVAAFLFRKSRPAVQINAISSVLFVYSILIAHLKGFSLKIASFDPTLLFLILPLLFQESEIDLPIAPSTFIPIAFLLPFSEEVLFRGCLLRDIGLFWSSLIFSLLHLLNVLSGIEKFDFYPFLARFLAGMAFGIMVLQSGSLFPSILCHAVVNALAFFSSRR